MVHPGGPRRLGGFPLPPPPAPLKQHCKMQSSRPTAPPRHFGRAGRRLHLAPAAPPPGSRGPRRLQARAAAAEALAHAPPAVQAPSRAAGGAGGRAYERAHTQRGPATAAHPPPAWRAERAGPAAGRARSAARLAALVQRGKPKYQFQTLGKHSAPRAARMRLATPPPGGGPAPTAFTPLTVPGRGAAGREAGPHEGVACHCRWGPGSRRGQQQGRRGRGCRRPETLLGVWHSVADLLGGAARRLGTAEWWPAPLRTLREQTSLQTAAFKTGLHKPRSTSSRLTAFPRLPARYK